MASLRSIKLFQRQANRLNSIGIRNQWIIVQNNSGYELRADVTLPDNKINSQCYEIADGKKNSWPMPIGQYKVWLGQGGGGMFCAHPVGTVFLVNKQNNEDCIIEVGDHMHYHIKNGSEEALPQVLE
eukprot:118462_1